MLVAEAIERKNKIKQSIQDLDYYLEKVSSIPNIRESSSVYNKVINNMFELLDNYQSHIILLYNSNNNVSVKVGETELTVTMAIALKRTIDEKINILTKIITSNDASISVPELLKQRDKLFEEQLIIKRAIEQSDWSTELD